MRIALDARTFKPTGGGIALYVNKLAHFLAEANQVILFCRENTKIADFGFEPHQQKNVQIVILETKTSLPTAENIRLDYDVIPELLQKLRVDVYHAPANWGTVSSDLGIPQVLTVHDLIPFQIREGALADPDNFTLYEKVMRQSVMTADKIITISEFSKKEIKDVFGIEEQKIVVAYNGADLTEPAFEGSLAETFLSERGLGQGKYFIYVGGFHERKNLLGLVEGFKIFSSDSPEFKLVVTGDNQANDYLKSQYELFTVACRGFEDQIKFLGYVSESDKNVLIANSVGLVYPSYYEGFGLPIIEGMELGVPVICSDTSCLPEIGGSIPFYFYPDDFNDIAKALREVVTNTQLVKSKITLGRERAKMFDWHRTFEKIISVYGALLNQLASTKRER